MGGSGPIIYPFVSSNGANEVHQQLVQKAVAERVNNVAPRDERVEAKLFDDFNSDSDTTVSDQDEVLGFVDTEDAHDTDSSTTDDEADEMDFASSFVRDFDPALSIVAPE